jgi:hypothetical protein
LDWIGYPADSVVLLGGARYTIAPLGIVGPVEAVGLLEAEFMFDPDLAVGEEVGHFRSGQNPGAPDHVCPEGHVLGPLSLEFLAFGFGHLLVEGLAGVGVDREMVAGGLDPVGVAEAADVSGKGALLGFVADMFDDGVAKDDVEGLVGEAIAQIRDKPNPVPRTIAKRSQREPDHRRPHFRSRGYDDMPKCESYGGYLVIRPLTDRILGTVIIRMPSCLRAR